MGNKRRKGLGNFIDYDCQAIQHLKELHELLEWTINNSPTFHSEIQKTAVEVIKENIDRQYARMEFTLLRLNP